MQAVESCRGRPIKDVCTALGLQHNQLSRILRGLSKEITKRVGPSRKAGGVLVLTDVGIAAITRVGGQVGGQTPYTPEPTKPKPTKPKAEKSADAPELAAMIAALRAEHEAYVLERTGGPWVTSAPESIGIRKLASYLLRVSKPDASADVVAASFYGGVRAVAAINKWHGEKSVKAAHLGENVSEIINAYKTHKEHEQRNKPATRVEKSHDATVAELRRRAESGQLG